MSTNFATYATVAEADDYLSRLYGDVYDNWLSLSEENREKAIFTATRRIDRLPLVSYPADPDQGAHFPIAGQTVVPDDVKWACAELAATLADNRDLQMDYEEIAISSHKLGKVGVNRDTDVRLPHVLAGIPSLEAWRLLRPFIRVNQNINLLRVN